MTCAIAFPYNGGYLIAADRCATDTFRAHTRVRKVFRIEGCHVAFAGTLADCQTLIRRFAAGLDHSVDALADLVVAALKENPKLDVEFLYLDKDGITHVDGAGAQLLPLMSHIGIGNGADYAAGYLGCALGLKPDLTLEQAKLLARNALKETSKYCVGVAPPFDIYTI